MSVAAASRRFRTWRLVGNEDSAVEDSGLRLASEPQVIGSAPQCSLPIASGVVAPQHAEVWSGPIGPLLRDLGTDTGTYVNSRRIDAPWRLCWGDLVQFGDADFRLIEEFGSARLEEGPPKLSLHGRPIVKLDDPRSIIAVDLVGKLETGAWRDPKPVHVSARELCRKPDAAALLEAWVEDHADTGGERPAVVLHAAARELLDFGLHHDLCHLRELAPGVPFIVQVHQTALEDAETTRALQLVVHALDMKLACTDFAASPARLSHFRAAAPDYVCVGADDLCGAGVDARLTTEAASCAQSAGIELVARGIATTGHLQACQAFGVELGGGPLFGALRPISSAPTAAVS